MRESFKRCSFCGTEWGSREEFLADREIQLEGYQWQSAAVKQGMPPDGILVFTHTKAECGTSLAVESSMFRRSSSNPATNNGQIKH